MTSRSPAIKAKPWETFAEHRSVLPDARFELTSRIRSSSFFDINAGDHPVHYNATADLPRVASDNDPKKRPR
jgi:hypothetical protein